MDPGQPRARKIPRKNQKRKKIRPIPTSKSETNLTSKKPRIPKTAKFRDLRPNHSKPTQSEPPKKHGPKFLRWVQFDQNDRKFKNLKFKQKTEQLDPVLHYRWGGVFA